MPRALHEMASNGATLRRFHRHLRANRQFTICTSILQHWIATSAVLWLAVWPVYADQVLKVTPDNALALREAVQWYAQGQEAMENGDHTHAIDKFQRSIEAYPLAGAFNNLGMLIFQTTQDEAQALDIFRRGAGIAKETNDTQNYASTYNNLGHLIRQRNRHSIAYCLEAIEYFDEALAANPDFIDALYNKASALHAMRQNQEAERLYRRVLELNPNYVGAHLDLGSIHFARGEIDEAVHHLDAVIALATSDFALLGALNNKGHFLKANEHYVEALQVHEHAVALAPENPMALVNLVTSKRTLCLWESIEEIHERLLHSIRLELLLRPKGVSLLPYDSTLLPVPDRFRKQLAEAYSKEAEQSATLELLPPVDLGIVDALTDRPSRPLRIAYLTFDFRDHPMGHLTLGLLDTHDSSRVGSFCYSYGTNDASEWRLRAESQCDIFHDVAMVSDLEAAQRVALDQVDIVVDLMAHTRGARLGITAMKPSPIIVNYLGYPGTTGSPFTDFIMADRHIVPPEVAASTITEQVVYLPHTYQVNQYDLHIPACSEGGADCVHHRNRLRHDLPLDAIVFCNFNTIDKMEPRTFGAWMNILRRVPRSVLWLLAPSKRYAERIQSTLLDEAEAHGIHRSRIIFAERVSKREHLARITLADLFLDSFIYNAHSTAADALWANVPIVTLNGHSFPSRVAAALIRNVVNLPELIPHSVREYEDLAVLLAQEPSLLRRIRNELARLSIASPLFDTNRTTRSIEAAYDVMHDVYHRFSHQKADGNTLRFQMIIHPEASKAFTPFENTERRLTDAAQRAITMHHDGQLADAVCIYERVLRVRPDHIDALHLLGIALHQLGDHEQAIHQLTRAIDFYPEIALFRFNRAIVHMARGDTAAAISDLRDVLRLDPQHVDAFKHLTDILNDRENYQQLVEVFESHGDHFLKTAPNIPDQEREQGYLRFSYSLARLGRNEDAIELLECGRVLHPHFFRVGYNLAALYRAIGKTEAADEHQITTAFVEAQHRFHSEGRFFQKLARPPGRRVIAFYCHEYGQSWWDAWGPSSLSRGLGGSEEAVVFMTRELQKLGYWIEVYGNPPVDDMTPHRDHDVIWYPHYTYDPDDTGVDVFIAWRYHISLSLSRRSRHKFFWIHDMPSPEAQQSKLLTEFVDGIFCLSQFHASQFPPNLQHKVLVTSNALDPAYFVDGKNKPNHFVYGSSPSRGLEKLLRAWPRIRTSVSNATLTVYYGFTPAFLSWGRRNIAHFDSWKLEIDHLLTQEGVQYVGLVDHLTLARGYAAAGFYLYPTTFSETSCVSLMKAMANGAIPITSRFPMSALSETCGDFDLGPRPLAYPAIELDPTWEDLWIRSIVEAVEQEQATNELQVLRDLGIGKSVFYAYFCDQFRKKHTDMWVVAASFLGGNIHLVAVFKPGEDPVYEKPHRSQGLMHKIMEEATHANVQVVHLYDGPPSTLYSDNLTVVFTSPNEKWLRQVEKDYCTYYMPLWTLEELQEAAVDLGFSLSDSTIEERFETFGGIENMHGAIKAITSTDELRNLLSKNENSETRHRLLHYVPKENGKKGHTVLASPFVIELLSERMMTLTNNNRTNMRLIFSPIEEASGLLGHIFAVDAHTALSKTRTLQLRPLLPGLSVTSFTIQASEQVDVFEATTLSSSTITRGPYHKPKARNWESIDSFYLEKKTDLPANRKVTKAAAVEV
ncbi:hypothetical protein Poli38472_000290 [Pythium oligandrum]|uniref:protein O-GlcNAc transferase n=1 Tax=Pythium oligandrum TaxID=41045 RepID=A0A8K1CCR9_PYTOL|nr:hypothetical protein Poli38472_000290 [Pythium oligandrum]|eukprot:TMW60248.1 hypothetical protein Poli38472_000290 [Pythium oligandrum]